MFDDLDNLIANDGGSWGYDNSALVGDMLDAGYDWTDNDPTPGESSGLTGDPYNDLPSYQAGDMGAAKPGALGAVADGEVAKTGEEPSAMSKVGKALGLTDKNGNFDLTDPKTLEKLIKLGLGVGSFMNSMDKAKKPNNGNPTAQQLQAQLQQNVNNTWTPQQSQWANSYFQTPRQQERALTPASSLPSVIVPGKGYADGGKVGAGKDLFTRTRMQREQDSGLQDYTPVQMQQGTVRRSVAEPASVSSLLTTLPALFRALGFASDGAEQPQPQPGAPRFAEGGMMVDEQDQPHGFLGLVTGAGGGQDDLVDARLSPGEYVFDAETVSMVGDGSTERGAQLLDEWRQNLREHKRSAPPEEIPEPTGALGAYMEGGE